MTTQDNEDTLEDEAPVTELCPLPSEEFYAEDELQHLIGKTIVRIEGLKKYSEGVTFYTSDGGFLYMYHEQDCCEAVSLEDFVGEVSDLVGSPILLAEEATSRDTGLPGTDDSNTWTFYRFRTAKGSLDLRWCGSSNGYYSESVSLHWTESKAS